MSASTDDVRIASARPLITPWVLAEELPLPAAIAADIADARRAIERILANRDPRVLAIVGPCSVHDPEALLDFARQFKAICEPLRDVIFPVLRVYFEKPRTVVGWKGLINDPALDGSFHINRGLHLARKVLLDVGQLGLPAASEFLDTTFGQYYADLSALARSAHAPSRARFTGSWPPGCRCRWDSKTAPMARLGWP